MSDVMNGNLKISERKVVKRFVISEANPQNMIKTNDMGRKTNKQTHTSSLQTTKLSWSNTVGCRISLLGNTPQVNAAK